MSRWARAMFKVGGRTLSAIDTAAYFAQRNGISIDAARSPLPVGAASRPKTSVVRTLYHQPAKPPVTLYEVRGGGHTIPGAQAAPRFLGRTNADLTLVGLVSDAVADLTQDHLS